MRPFVLAACGALVLAACGSPPPAVQPEMPPAEGAPHAGIAAPPVASAPVAVPPAGSAPPTPGGAAPKAEPALGNNTPLQASKLVDEVRKLGVDPTAPLADLTLAKKKKLMPLFVKALGYEGCTGCHAGSDYERETRNIKIARKMWDEFVVGMRDAQGGALFCDSCHGGRAKSLDRSHMEGLQKVMETDYQGKLTRADKRAHDCSTCHGKGPELKIIEKLWGIAAN